MKIVCQISDEEDLATLTSAWEKFGGDSHDWVAVKNWGEILVSFIPPGQFHPTHNYGIGSCNGQVLIVDHGVAPIFAGTDLEEDDE